MQPVATVESVPASISDRKDVGLEHNENNGMRRHPKTNDTEPFRIVQLTSSEPIAHKLAEQHNMLTQQSQPIVAAIRKAAEVKSDITVPWGHKQWRNWLQHIIFHEPLFSGDDGTFECSLEVYNDVGLPRSEMAIALGPGSHETAAIGTWCRHVLLINPTTTLSQDMQRALQNPFPTKSELRLFTAFVTLLEVK